MEDLNKADDLAPGFTAHQTETGTYSGSAVAHDVENIPRSGAVDVNVTSVRDFVDNTTGGQMTHTAAAVNKAYPNADPAVVARNNAEINAAVAAAEKPKLVRHLLQQRIDEALFEAKRLQTQLDEAPAALLDCTLDQAQKIFG